MDQSFTALRSYARDHDLRLTEVARSAVARELAAQELLDHSTSGR